jgi:hypothetical protein
MANKSFEWFGTDTYEKFQSNLLEKKYAMKRNGWTDTNVFSYQFNNNGFRCSNFTTEPTIMFLGCSLTFGIGIPIENSWPQIVSASLGLHNANLAWPGSSNDTAFRTAYHFMPIVNPSMVVMLSPAVARFDLAVDDKMVFTFLPSNYPKEPDTETNNEYGLFYQTWMSSDANIELNRLKNILAIRQMCESKGIKFVHLLIEDIKPVDLARDLLHFGIQTNKNIADKFLKKI